MLSCINRTLCRTGKPLSQNTGGNVALELPRLLLGQAQWRGDEKRGASVIPSLGSELTLSETNGLALGGDLMSQGLGRRVMPQSRINSG